MASVPWTDLTMSGETLATKDAVDPIIHKGYLDELADAYLPAGIDRPACFPSLCEPEGPPADADPSGIGRDVARGRHTLRRRSRCRRCACEAGNLAAHDPCMALVERAFGA